MIRRTTRMAIFCFFILLSFSNCKAADIFVKTVDLLTGVGEYEEEEYKIIDKDTGEEKTYVLKKKIDKKKE